MTATMCILARSLKHMADSISSFFSLGQSHGKNTWIQPKLASLVLAIEIWHASPAKGTTCMYYPMMHNGRFDVPSTTLVAVPSLLIRGYSDTSSQPNPFAETAQCLPAPTAIRANGNRTSLEAATDMIRFERKNFIYRNYQLGNTTSNLVPPLTDLIAINIRLAVAQWINF